MMPTHGDVFLDQKELVGPWITPPSSEIIREGAAKFMDITETILDVLDKQVISSTSSQHAKRLSLRRIKRKRSKKRNHQFLPK